MGTKYTAVIVLMMFLVLAGLMSQTLVTLNGQQSSSYGSSNTIIRTTNLNEGIEPTIKGSSIPSFLRTIERIGGIVFNYSDGEEPWNVREFIDSEEAIEYFEDMRGINANTTYRIFVSPEQILTISEDGV